MSSNEHSDTQAIRRALCAFDTIPPEVIADLCDDLDRTRSQLASLLKLGDRIRLKRGHGDPLRPSLLRSERSEPGSTE